MALHHQLTDRDIRLAQAMADFQMALSAADFLLEIDEAMPISRVERRRYRCIEDAGVVAYWRPFTQCQGLPALSFKKLGLKPTHDQIQLHLRLKEHRNKVIAHTDIDRMRLAFSASKLFEDKNVLMPSLDFDDGLIFLPDRMLWIVWLRTLIHAAAEILYDKVQGGPEIRFVRDHLEPREE